MPICLHLPLQIVLLWYLPKGGFLTCPPQDIVREVAHTSVSLTLHLSANKVDVSLSFGWLEQICTAEAPEEAH
jgi:hypothetical protein